MNPEPASVLNGYIDRLNRLKESNPPNLMALKSIEREALQLINTDAQTAYLVLGIIYAIKNQAKESRDYFRKSLNLADDLVTRANFAYSLVDLQYYQDAMQEYDYLLRRTIISTFMRQPASRCEQVILKKLSYSVKSLLSYNLKLVRIQN